MCFSFAFRRDFAGLFSLFTVLLCYKKRGKTLKGEINMKTYKVLIINERGVYETVAKGVNGRLAGAIKRHYMSNGIWAQVMEENE